jgi:hypothetical protein
MKNRRRGELSDAFAVSDRTTASNGRIQAHWRQQAQMNGGKKAGTCAGF